jgi:transcriptional regulator with XRE-family HTH domain
MTPLQRKAALRSAATLEEISMATAARRLGVSYNHLMLVLAGTREGSLVLKHRIATFVGRAPAEMFTLQKQRERYGTRAVRAP